MHSSDMRGSDFDIRLDGRQVPHADAFGDVTVRARLGVICPEPLDGLGAALFVLARTTAFYDGYRSQGGEFFAYPDHFTFQLRAPAADYGMLDIWPRHKNVSVAVASLADAITDRGVDTLLLPRGWSGAGALQPVQRAALARTVTAVWEFGPSGVVDPADLTLRGMADPVDDWVGKVAASADAPTPAWATHHADGHVEQSFRRLDATQLLTRL